MKKTMITFLLLGLLTQTQAQLRDVMLKKAGDKIKKNKTENASTGNSGAGTTDPKTGQNTTTPADSASKNAGANPYAMFGQGGKKDILPAYKFDQNVLMEMKKYDKKGNLEEKSSGKMRMHFGQENYNGNETYDDKNVSHGFMIFDANKKQMVMLMDNNGSKVAMVRTIDPAKFADKQGSGKDGNKPTVTKTGRTKKVCGYSCEEWVSAGENGEKSEMWISSEVPIKTGGLYSMFGQSKDMGQYFSSPSEYPTGMMLDMTHYDSKGEKFTMTATEVNLNAPKTVETAGYQVY